MTPSSAFSDPNDQAIAWFVRLQDDGAAESDWIAFRDWLEADARHRDAYDVVERLWLDLDDVPAAEIAAPTAEVRAFRPRQPAWRRLSVGPLAAAAAVCVVAIGISWSFWPTPTEPPPAQVYETARAQPREVALADGSKIHLNGASKLEVRFEPGRRTAVLDKGEAAFEVAHDTARPFLIAAGDRTVRVVGTQFNVLRHEGDLTVTVREGIVTVGGQDDPAPTDVRLAAGQQLRHHEGASSSEVTNVEPDDAFAWRRGVLVYHDRPLSEVSADLDRYVATPVRVDPSAVGIRFTGVLRVDTEEAMVKRLETFLPITAERTDNEIRLRARARP